MIICSRKSGAHQIFQIQVVRTGHSKPSKHKCCVKHKRQWNALCVSHFSFMYLAVCTLKLWRRHFKIKLQFHSLPRLDWDNLCTVKFPLSMNLSRKKTVWKFSLRPNRQTATIVSFCSLKEQMGKLVLVITQYMKSPQSYKKKECCHSITSLPTRAPCGRTCQLRRRCSFAPRWPCVAGVLKVLLTESQFKEPAYDWGRLRKLFIHLWLIS